MKEFIVTWPKEMPDSLVELVRLLFTHFRAAFFLSKNGMCPPDVKYSADTKDASKIISFLHDVGEGGIRELTEMYFSGPDLHHNALNMLSDEVLNAAGESLFSALQNIEGDLAQMLLELITLVDLDTGKLNADILRFKSQNLYEMWRDHALTTFETNAFTLEYFMEKLNPLLQPQCGLHVVHREEQLWVEHRSKTCYDSGIKITQCKTAWGPRLTAGFATMPLLSHAQNEMLNSADTSNTSEYKNEILVEPEIFLYSEVAATIADILTFYPLSNTNTLLMDQCNKLAKLSPGNIYDRSGRYRELMRQIILSHEIGHIKTDKMQAEIILNRFDSKRFCEVQYEFNDSLSELFADAWVFSELGYKESEELLYEFYIARYLEVSSLWKHKASLQEYQKTHYNFIFTLQALLLENSSDYLYELTDEIITRLASGDLRSYRRWLEQKIYDTTQSIFKHLHNRLSL